MCMYMCFVCVHVCVCGHMWVMCMCILHACVCVCVCVRVCVCVPVCVCVCALVCVITNIRFPRLCHSKINCRAHSMICVTCVMIYILCLGLFE